MLIFTSDIQECHISTSTLTSVIVEPAGKVAVDVELPPSPLSITITGKAAASKSKVVVVSVVVEQSAVKPVAAKSPFGSPAHISSPVTVGAVEPASISTVICPLTEQVPSSTTTQRSVPTTFRSTGPISGDIKIPPASGSPKYQSTGTPSPTSASKSCKVIFVISRSGLSQNERVFCPIVGAGRMSMVICCVITQPGLQF